MCLHVILWFTSEVSSPNDSKLLPWLKNSNLASNLRQVGSLLTFLCTNHKHAWTVLLRQHVPSILNGFLLFRFFPCLLHMSTLRGKTYVWMKESCKSNLSVFRQGAPTTPGCSLPPAKSPSKHSPSNTHSNPTRPTSDGRRLWAVCVWFTGGVVKPRAPLFTLIQYEKLPTK